MWSQWDEYSVYVGTTADEQEFSVHIRHVYLSEVSCSGNETSIFECSHTISISGTCSDGVAAIVCQGMYYIPWIVKFLLLKIFRQRPFPTKLNMRNILCNIHRPIPILVTKVWQWKLDHVKNLQAKYFIGENIPIYGILQLTCPVFPDNLTNIAYVQWWYSIIIILLADIDNDVTDSTNPGM